MTHSTQVTRTRQDLINTGEAFGKMNEKFNSSSSELSRRHEYKSNGKKRLSEFCYSISNLILIVASVIALCVLIKFIQDDPLYKYGEHLLSLHFYRQLIYIIVLLPLVLLLPIFNALSALLLAHGTSKNESLVRLKLAYQVLMLLMVLLALIFVAPYIRASNLSSQLELELRKHMKFRYERQFSYEFIDQIQESYECCDEFWYRANFDDQLPASCFVPATNLSQIYDQTCANALGSLISIRCSIIAACLLLLLACLSCLIATDLVHLTALSSSQPSRYKISNAQSAHQFQLEQQERRQQQQAAAAAAATADYSDYGDDDDEHQSVRINSFRKRDDAHQAARDEPAAAGRPRAVPMIGGQDDPINELLRKPDSDSFHASLATNRLKNEERQRQVPLLEKTDLANDDEQRPPAPPASSSTSSRKAAFMATSSPIDLSGSFHCFDDIDSQQQQQFELDEQELAAPTSSRRQEPVVLARANLRRVERNHSQSPLFEAAPGGSATASNTHPTSTTKPIKSALKKTSSSQQLAGSSADDADSGSFHFRRDSHDADADSLDEYAEKLRQSNSLLRQKSLQREQPTRRSLLSVRFAE